MIKSQRFRACGDFMAVADDTVTIRLSETLLNCQICMDPFDSPRILPCQHNLCRSCLLTLALHQCVGGRHPADGEVITTARISCPECRKKCRVGNVGNAFDTENLFTRYPENKTIRLLAEAAQDYNRNEMEPVYVKAENTSEMSSLLKFDQQHKMAVADDTVTIRLSETLLNCQICMDRFESPRILPCQHNVCRSCLLTFALRQCVGGKHPADGGVIQTTSFACPECKRKCGVGNVGSAFNTENLLARYPENRIIKHLIEETQKNMCIEVFQKVDDKTVHAPKVKHINTKHATQNKCAVNKLMSEEDVREATRQIMERLDERIRNLNSYKPDLHIPDLYRSTFPCDYEPLTRQRKASFMKNTKTKKTITSSKDSGMRNVEEIQCTYTFQLPQLHYMLFAMWLTMLFVFFLQILYPLKVEQDTRNDVVLDVKTSVFRSMAVTDSYSQRFFSFFSWVR